MAPVQTLYRLVWGGRLYEAEQWSCSLHVNSPAGLNLAASTFQAALTAWMGDGGAAINDKAHLDEIKFNEIVPTTGRYALPTTNVLAQNDIAVGTTQGGAPQLSLVISLRTALPRGRGHAGRFYSPTGNLGVGSDGRISAVAAAGAAAAGAQLVSSINDVVAVGTGKVVVFSKIAQTVQEVTSVRVGRVIDTMRSRRTSLSEEPSAAPLP